MKNIEYIECRGGFKLVSPYISEVDDAKSDEYIRSKFGDVYVEPLLYGGVHVDSNEMKVLSLPPKFAVHETVNVNDLELESRKAGVKLRWNERSKRENSQVGLTKDVETEVRDVSYWLKGTYNVDFSKKRVTSMKGNRKFLIPGPVHRKDFEVHWHNVELDCIAAAKRVDVMLKNTYGDKRFLNLDMS